jgi:DNA-binding HxlR family transcriptional regulator
MVAKHSAVPDERSRRKAEEREAARQARTKRQDATPGELDRLIHERMRLGIVSALAGTESLSFNDLKHALETTDGNLSVHARKLEDAGYITCTKSFEGRVPKTDYALTAAGRRAFERYLDHMEAIIRRARER